MGRCIPLNLPLPATFLKTAKIVGMQTGIFCLNGHMAVAMNEVQLQLLRTLIYFQRRHRSIKFRLASPC